MTILTMHQVNQEHLAEVMEQAEEIGSVTLNTYFDGETYHMLEGVHRTEAAKRLGLPIILVTHEWDDIVSTDCEDVEGFDSIERTAKVSDIVDYAYSNTRFCGIYATEDFVEVEVR